MNHLSMTPEVNGPETKIRLDGIWSVRKWPFHESESSLAAPQADDSAWSQIQQPGKVFYADPDAEGKETPNWNRVTLTHIDPDDGAVLRRMVSVPADWREKQIFLRFDAVFPAGRFYVNGTLLGEHLSGLTPVEFDVTGLVEPGSEAVVAVRLIRRHTFVKMDMVRHALEFGGLAQSAVLFAVEPCRIREHHLISSLDKSLQTGTVQGTVSVANAINGSKIMVVVGEVKTEAAVIEGKADIRLTMNNPKLWNDEYPNLYPVCITLCSPGQPDQTVSYRTGFRTLELRPEGPLLNGSFVKFRGVNHLTFHPEHGMHTPKEWLRENLLLMKKANVNCIRTHFLSPPDLCDLCDELGIYLLQEIPIDWGTDYIHDPEWVPPALLRIEGGVRRDRHHPSLMVWSVGNENMPNHPDVAEQGWSHLRQYDALVKQLDPSRPTMFPPPGPANAIKGIIELRVGDIADTHYSFHHIKEFLAKGEVDNPNSWKADMAHHTRAWALERGWSGVWFSSEYGIMNTMPDLLNHPHTSIISDEPEDIFSEKTTMQVFTERLAREWGFMRNEPSCLGGAYFPWLCCGAGSAEAGNPWGWVRWGEDADWGVVTADLLPKPFFWALRVLFSPVWFPRRVTWKKGASDLRFTVQNQYNSIDLNQCTLRVQQKPSGRYMTMLRKFKDLPVQCAPGETAEIRIPLEENVLAALNEGLPGLCRITLLDPSGFRPVTAEMLIFPEGSTGSKKLDETLPVGPDAVL